MEDGTRVFAAWVFGPGAWEEAVPDELKRVMLANAATFLDEERAPDNGFVDAPRLHEVTVPILLTTGEDSHPAFHVVTERLVAGLPYAERRTMAGAGHVPHRSHPQEYAALLSSFWPASTRAETAPAGASPSRSAGSAC